jgi:hypothetical protein
MPKSKKTKGSAGASLGWRSRDKELVEEVREIVNEAAKEAGLSAIELLARQFRAEKGTPSEEPESTAVPAGILDWDETDVGKGEVVLPGAGSGVPPPTRKGEKQKKPSFLDGWEEYGVILEKIPNQRLLRDRERVLRILTLNAARPLPDLPTLVQTRLDEATETLTKEEKAFLLEIDPRLASAFYTNLVIGRPGEGTVPFTLRGGR